MDALGATVPDGKQLKNDITKLLCEQNEGDSEDYSDDTLQSVFGYFDDDEMINDSIRRKYYKEHFTDVKFNAIRKKIFDIDWPYVYTLNIDDGIEKNTGFNETLLCNRKANDKIFDERKCVIKLHGDIHDYLKYHNSMKVFSAKEYAESLREDEYMLEKFKDDCSNNNLIIIGCSLSNEYDLLTAMNVPFSETNKISNVRKICCTVGNPTPKAKSRYRDYNITDVIVFNNYDEIYTWLYDVWHDSTCISIDDLKEVTRLSIRNITDAKEHEEYFYYCKSLVDARKKEVSFPTYFIQRKSYNEIEKTFSTAKVHLITGNRFSGRSYFLAAIYRKFFNLKDIYYFDSRNTPNDKTIDYLFKQKDTIQLYDVGSLRKNSFQKIIEETSTITENQNTVVIVIGRDTTEFIDFVKDFLYKNPTCKNNILRHELVNRFDAEELLFLNEKLPAVNIPPFNAGTILDNLIRIPEEMQRRGKFSREHLEITDEKDLILFLILAIKESITSREVEKFGIQKQVYKFMTKYDWLLESIERSQYSKSAGDNSSLVYTVNSRYWLCLELGNYVKNSENISNVVAAYIEIVKKCIRYRSDEVTKLSLYRNCYKPYIQFNSINAIFLTKKGGQLYLPLKIYEDLMPYLATDFQFIHQFSKCCLRYSYLLENDEKMRIEQLEEALKKVNLVKSMLNMVIRDFPTEGQRRSLAHFEYTQATVQCELFRLKYNTLPDEFKNTVDIVYNAIISPYNTDDYKNDSSRSQGIKTFIQSMPSMLIKFQDAVNSETLTKSRNIQQIAKDTELGKF